MKKIFLLLLLVFSTTWAKDIPLAPFLKLKFFSDGKLTLQRVYDHGSLYQVKFLAKTPQGPRIFKAFLTKDKKVLIPGETILMASGEALEMPNEALNIKKIAQNADIIYGTGKTKLIVVTDPECYYCQVFQERWPELKRKYTLYVFLYPLGHHKEAKQMSYHVLKQKSYTKRANALIQIAKDAHADRLVQQRIQGGESGLKLTSKAYEKTKVSQKEQKKFEEKLEKNSLFGSQLGVRGTPSVFDTKGDSVVWNRLF